MADAHLGSAEEPAPLDHLLRGAAAQLAQLPRSEKQAAPLSLGDAIQAPLAALYEEKKKKDGPGSKSKSKAGIQGPDQLRGALMCAEEEKSTFWMFAEVRGYPDYCFLGSKAMHVCDYNADLTPIYF